MQLIFSINIYLVAIDWFFSFDYFTAVTFFIDPRLQVRKPGSIADF